MLFSDIGLARRLERAEGRACAGFADAQRELPPESAAEWIECAGTLAVFNGVDSPVTQSFGLGLFEELSAASLDQIERFFFDRGTAAVHEVSPLAGVVAMDLLCARSYKPIEISSVMYRVVEHLAPPDCSASMTVSRCSAERPQFPNCDAAACNRRYFVNVCAMPSSTAATSR